MAEPRRISSGADERAIAERAAEWFGRFELGLTPAEEEQLLRWLESDPRHGEAMREMDETWDFMDRMKDSPSLRERVEFSRPARRYWLAAGVGLAAAAVAMLFLPPTISRVSRETAQYEVVDTDGMKKVELRDGSIVHLNGSSRIRVSYSTSERRLELLAGEAHFAVKRDPSRPFVVVVDEIAIKAVGTAFNIRREAQGIEVFVTEGKVRLDDIDRGASLLPRAQEPEVLVAGHRAVVARTAPAASPSESVAPVTVAPMAPAEMQQALAWQERQLEFDQQPLAGVVADFNRHNSHQLVIADAELGQRPFGGSFRADNLQGFVQLLEERFGVRVERGRDRTVLHARP